MKWSVLPFEEAVASRGSGTQGLPQSEWRELGDFPVIGQGAEAIEGWTDRKDLLITPDPALVLYGGHTRRAKYVDRPFVPGPNVKILSPVPGIDPRFLYWFLVQLVIESRGYADHFPQVRRCEIPVPPLPEQKRIAAILDAADAMRAKRRESIEQLDSLVQATFLEMFGDPEGNSRGWHRVPLARAGRITTGKTPPGNKQGMFGSDLPFVTPGDLGGGLATTERSLTLEGTQHCRVVRAGAALVGCIGNIGKMARTPVVTAFNQQINAVEWDTSLIADWFGLHALRFEIPQMLRKASATTLPILNKGAFEKVTIIAPPLALQNRFASIVETIDQQKVRLKAHLAELDALFASLQTRAFNGELAA